MSRPVTVTLSVLAGGFLGWLAHVAFMFAGFVSGFLPIDGLKESGVAIDRWGYGSLVVGVSAGMLVGLLWSKGTKNNTGRGSD